MSGEASVHSTTRNRVKTAGTLLVMFALATAACTGGAQQPAPERWATHMRAMDEAAGRGATDAARTEWRMAYAAALASRRWEDMLATGDAALRIGQAPGTRRAWEYAARRAYLSALLYAHEQGSLDGVLRAGEAFAVLGDRDVVRQALAIATPLAANSRDPASRERVRALRERWATASSFAENDAARAYP